MIFYHKRLLPVVILTTTLALTFLTNRMLRAAARDLSDAKADVAQVRLLESNKDGVRLVLDSPAPRVVVDQAVHIEGLETNLAAPGTPALPVFVAYLALPPEAQPVVREISGSPAATYFAGRVDPLPGAGEMGSGEDLAALGAMATAPSTKVSSAIYGADALYPHLQYELSEPMYYGDLRLVRLALSPLQYNPVSGIAQHTPRLEIAIAFEGGRVSAEKGIGGGEEHLQSLAPLVLNFADGQQWRGLPEDYQVAESSFPTNRDTFKIGVNQDGIYEVTYAALAAAGMDVGSVNPQTFEMMYRGQPVAYQFVGNDNATFEAHESIRFYGWAFDGSRLERQFLTENVFWLWADGTPTALAAAGNVTANPMAATFRENVTREPDVAFTHVWTDNWENAPNEPDAWIWDRVQKRIQDWPVIERIQEITLPVPASTGTAALVTVELLSRENRPDHAVSIYLNGNDAMTGELQWTGARSVNVTMTVPMDQLSDGVNQVHVVYQTPVTNSADSTIRTPALYYLNRITVEYDHLFTTGDEQLQFTDSDGHSTYQVAGFSNGDAGSALVWEISNRLHPSAINLDGADVTGSGPYTYRFGANAGSNSFIATHAANVRSPLSIEKYVAPDLNLPEGADWLVISHARFRAQAERLAAHRSHPTFGAYHTQVVDVRDVINQYGYGLPLPGAIRHFLQHALANWAVAPQHLLLFGDGHINPRQIPCNPGNTQCSHWATTPETNFVLTDIVFKDQFVGINASDYSYTLLVGDDLLPDITVGRLPVQTEAEARIIVDKIIDFEEARLTEGAWQRNLLFVADNQDTAGNFCEESVAVANTIPADYMTETACLQSNSQDDIDAARILIHDAVNNPPQGGATFLNYRGHGAVRSWAGSLINLDDPDDHWTPWFNNEPLVVLSMDCLDGHFAQPGVEALSEVFMAEQSYGSVAHWSSSGYGYDFQHRPLHQSFYDGLFNHDLVALGDAINYAKMSYILLAHHPSQLYSFVLQGDPAMETIRIQYELFLPALNG